MFKVTYSYYGKYNKERQFDDYAQARGFWNSVRRRRGVTRAELKEA